MPLPPDAPPEVKQHTHNVAFWFYHRFALSILASASTHHHRNTSRLIKSANWQGFRFETSYSSARHSQTLPAQWHKIQRFIPSTPS